MTRIRTKKWRQGPVDQGSGGRESRHKPSYRKKTEYPPVDSHPIGYEKGQEKNWAKTPNSRRKEATSPISCVKARGKNTKEIRTQRGKKKEMGDVHYDTGARKKIFYSSWNGGEKERPAKGDNRKNDQTKGGAWQPRRV